MEVYAKEQVGTASMLGRGGPPLAPPPAAPTQAIEGALGELVNQINQANAALDNVLLRLTGSAYPEKESGRAGQPVPGAFLPLMQEGLNVALMRMQSLHERIGRLGTL